MRLMKFIAYNFITYTKPHIYANLQKFKNGCSVCALSINKRRLSAGVAAAPQRHPLAALAGADQAHTLLKSTNEPSHSLHTKQTNQINKRA